MGISRRKLLAGIAAAPVLANAGNVFAQTPPPRRVVGLPSSVLQFQPTMEETIAMAKEAGFDAIEWNVRTGGHVLPENVIRDLPKAVDLSHKAGLQTVMICNAIQDAQSPYAEDILKAMNACGIRYYRSSNYFRYDYTKDVADQIEALRPRVASIAALNAKYGTTICYHTHSPTGATDLIAGNVWDMWRVLKDFDPRQAGFNYDTAHTTVDSGNDWRPAAYLAKNSIDGVAVKDFNWKKNPPGSAVYAQDEMCPLGEGLVDFKQHFTFFKEIGFNGPINIHYEHHGMLAPLSAGVGKAVIPQPRDLFMKLLTADLAYLRGKMQEAGYSA